MDNTAHIQALLEQNKVQEAIDFCSSLCGKFPQQSSVWLLSAGVYAQAGDLAKVADCCQHATRLEPENFSAHYNFGIALLQLGKPSEAETPLNRAHAINPQHALTLLGMGKTKSAIGDLNAAILLLRQCIVLDNSIAEAHYHLGICLADAGNSTEGMAELERTITLDPGHITAAYALATHKSADGDYAGAEQLFRSILAREPDNSDAIAGIALLLHYAGDDLAAFRQLSDSIKSGNITPNLAMVYGITANATGHHDEATRVMQELIHTNPCAAKMADLHFSLGDMLDKCSRYAEAFEHYLTANELLRPAYTPDRSTKLFSRIISTFDVDFFVRTGTSTYRSPRPVFIVGMPRSGTSLIEQILSSHPEIHGAGELEYISRMTNTLKSINNPELGFPESFGDIDTRMLDKMASNYLAKTSALNDTKARIIDKMPHNFLALGVIHILFPNAAIIHCTRNPIDTCLSIYFHHMTRNHPYTFDLQHLALYYKEYLKLMRHWHSVLPTDILEVNYESLIADPEGVIRQMLASCKLDWDDACLNFHNNKRLVTTPSYTQVTKPLYADSSGRWTHYREFIGPLMAHFPEAAKVISA